MHSTDNWKSALYKVFLQSWKNVLGQSTVPALLALINLPVQHLGGVFLFFSVILVLFNT